MRKRCRRRVVVPNPKQIFRTIEGLQPLDRDACVRMGARHWAAVDALAKGDGTDLHMRCLTELSNMLLALQEGQGTGGVKYHVEGFSVEEFRDALRSINERRLRARRLGVAAGELLQLRAGCDAFDSVIPLLHIQQFERLVVKLRNIERTGRIEVLEAPKARPAPAVQREAVPV